MEEDKTYPVLLRVYDLSRGLARNMSMPIAGIQIDGIWHTSIVVYGKEIFYGQGISIVTPGTSGHGAPVHVHPLGDTLLDPETWSEILDDIRPRYTADKYHLLDYNCNTFTNDVAQILTGNTIPEYIQNLPADFLSTGFGRMMRPQIDAMFQRAGPITAPAAPSPSVPAGDLLGQVAASAFMGNEPGSGPSQGSDAEMATVETEAGTATNAEPALPENVHKITSTDQFVELIESCPLVVALFGCESDWICDAMTPDFLDLATLHSGPHTRTLFLLVEVLDECAEGFDEIELLMNSIRSIPTVQLFHHGENHFEFVGADPAELRKQVAISIQTVYGKRSERPPHPHTKLTPSLTSLKTLPRTPITYTKKPKWSSLLSKLDMMIAAHPSPSSIVKKDVEEARRTLAYKTLWLERRFDDDGTLVDGYDNQTAESSRRLQEAVEVLLQALPPPALFPALDILRLGVLDPKTASYFSDAGKNVLLRTFGTVHAHTKPNLPDSAPLPGDPISGDHKILLITLRFLCNSLSVPSVSNALMASSPSRADMVSLLGMALLHTDARVREAAAGVAFNAALWAAEGREENGSRENTTEKVLSNENVPADSSAESANAAKGTTAKSATTGKTSTDKGKGKAKETAATAAEAAPAPAPAPAPAGEEEEEEDQGLYGYGPKYEIAKQKVDWENAIVDVLLQALKREEKSDEVVHRLSTSLLLHLYLSPSWSLPPPSSTNPTSTSQTLRSNLPPLQTSRTLTFTFANKRKTDVVRTSRKRVEIGRLLDDCERVARSEAQE